MIDFLRRVLLCVRSCASAVWRRLKPVAEAAPTLRDAVRTRRDLVLENALLRHQIVVLRRSVPRPKLTPLDRLRLLVAARLLPAWRRAVALVQPETVLRWHRLGFRLFWRHKSRSEAPPRIAADTIALIRRMTAENRLWGAERIRGELLKVGVRVSKRTIQRYMQSCRGKPGGQTWSTFIKNYGPGTSGRATSSRVAICSSAQSSSSSSSTSAPAASSTSPSHATPPRIGPPSRSETPRWTAARRSF
jgi:putative transposase